MGSPILALSLLLAISASAPIGTPPRLEFTRMVAHWAEYGDPQYLPFIEEARPEVAQVGFYGGHFWSLAHTEFGDGYPAHFPLRGLDECGAWLEDLNRKLHSRGVKVVGHFNVEFLVGELDGPQGPRGFFKFYRDLWDDKLLGPRPTPDPLSLLQVGRDGKPIANDTYKIGGMREYWGCLNNPDWRAVLKGWVKVAVARGVDGLIANYFYRHDCLCHHCVKGFKEYLAARHTKEILKDQFGIADLDTHRFDEIVGWHDPAKSSPLRREMLRFSQVSCKRAFDEVLVQHGRSLKADLIVAQWDHLGDFGMIAGDERCFLPAELWGRGEDYLWYSTGAAACFTDLAEGLLGEGTLQARFIRGSFDDKPFTLGKYESTRIRVAIAEMAANGGAAMGFYTNFKDPEARREIVRYYRFLRENDGVYRGNSPYGEAVLLFPRRSVHAGDLRPLDEFRRIGRKLLDEHVLFDVVPDDLASPTRLAAYRRVVEVSGRPPAAPPAFPQRSRFKTPSTVRVSASRPAAGGEIDLHFVNYDRKEPAGHRSPGAGIVEEKPIAVPGVDADLLLPVGARVAGVDVLTPEEPSSLPVRFEAADGRVRFTVPRFLVYSVARVRLEGPGR